MPKGLMNPKNAVESTGGGFREGNIRVDASTFRVHQPWAPEGQTPRQPHLALVWNVARLDEELNPLIETDDGSPTIEELIFGLGGKSLAAVHPGGADSPEDEEVEDLGTEVNTEGKTVFMANTDYKLNAKSSCIMLMNSLKEHGFKEEYLDRVWAPDFVGLVAHMKTLLDPDLLQDDGKGGKRGTPYKIVDRMIRAPYDKKPAAAKTKAPAAATSAKPAKNGDDAADAAVKALSPILSKLSEDLDGTRLTRKALTQKISMLLQGDKKVAPTLHVPILTLVKDNAWMLKHGQEFDMAFDPETNLVTFGEYAEPAGS